MARPICDTNRTLMGTVSLFRTDSAWRERDGSERDGSERDGVRGMGGVTFGSGNASDELSVNCG